MTPRPLLSVTESYQFEATFTRNKNCILYVLHLPQKWEDFFSTPPDVKQLDVAHVDSRYIIVRHSMHGLSLSGFIPRDLAYIG